MQKLLAKFFSLLCVFLIFSTSPAHAANRRKSGDFTASAKYASLVVDSESGEVIYHKNAKNTLHPASLTKMMTIYLAFQSIAEGDMLMNAKLKISARAASMPKTNLRLKAGQTITLRDAILGLIVHSANDASVVIAEAISGSEEAFARKMTSTAQALGMHDTRFENSNGLHDPDQITTAYDIAKLAIALRRDYPQYYPLFSTKSFKFNGRVINTHNRVMQRYPWADGLKTGYVNASGYNLVTTTNRSDGRLVGVVLGGSSAYARDTHMINLLEYGYNKISKLNQNTAIAKLKKQPIDKKPDIFLIAGETAQLSSSHQVAKDTFAVLASNQEILLDSTHADTQSQIIESQNTVMYDMKPILNSKRNMVKSYSKAKKPIKTPPIRPGAKKAKNIAQKVATKR